MRKRLIIALLSISLIITAIGFRISRYYAIACETFAETGVKGVITQDINKIIAETLNEEEISYEKIADINREESGKITSIVIRTERVNYLATQISDEIYSSISNYDNAFGIPLGNILGFKYLSGEGPKIGVKIVPIGTIEYEINSELISGGINQTLHRISLKYETAIKCIVPFHECDSTIATEIIISETLIIGDVPEIIVSPLG